MTRTAARARSVALAIGWLAAAVLIALGAAGLVTGLGGPPDSPARPELTWKGDAAIEPGLDAATADLAAIRDDLAGLSRSARVALAALVGTDRALLQQSIDEGSVQAGAVDAEVGALRSTLLDLPGVALDADGRLSPSTALVVGSAARERYERLDAALRDMRNLAADWTRFSGGSVAGLRLTTLMLEHDASTAAAAMSGRAGRYGEALEALDTSDAHIAEMRTIRDRLANTVDVVTLTEWIDRSAAYDTALRDLYAALDRTGGVVDEAARAAFAAERAAKDRLPPDTRGPTIILAEIARGGMNEIAIGIERARGELDEALADLEAPPAGTPSGG